MSAISMCDSISRFQGHTPKVSALGQGMCQNSTMRRLGPPRAQLARQQREVIVLDQDHRILGLRLLRATTSAKLRFTD